MKKRIFTFLTILLTALLLVGCINDGGGEEDDFSHGDIYADHDLELFPEGHLVERPITIEFWSANSAVDIQGKAMANLVEEFNEYQQETYPDSPITVNPSFSGGYIAQNTKLQAAIPAGTNPEMAMVGVSSMALYHQNVVDMRRVFTMDQIKDIIPGFLQFAMYRDKFVAYPYFAASNIIAINKTLLQETGMHIPTVDEIVADPENSIWTWDYFAELIQAVRELEGSEENEIFGLATNGIPLYESFFSHGEQPYNANATKTAFTDETATKIFTYWQDLAKNGYIENPVIDPQHHNQIRGKFTNGKAAMLIASSSIVLDLHDSVPKDENGNPKFEVDILPHPKEKYFYSNQSGGGLLIFNNKAEARQKASVEFMRWLQAPEQSAKFSTACGYLITTNAARETSIWQDYKAINPTMDEVIKVMHFSPQDGLTLPIGRSKAQADDEFGKYSNGIFFENYKNTPASVVKETRERVDYILDVNKE